MTTDHWPLTTVFSPHSCKPMGFSRSHPYAPRAKLGASVRRRPAQKGVDASPGYGILVLVKFIQLVAGVPSENFLRLLLAATIWATLAGCGSAPVQAPQEAPPVVQHSENHDQARLRAALTGQELPPGEVAALTDRLLTAGNEVSEQDMARLELLLLKAIKSPDKSHHAALWRNLGIIHYHQRKYKAARQELQTSIELNPKNGRSRYYLARLCMHQGEIYERQGQKAKARQQFKRAAIEMDLARKFEPGNPLFRQDIKQMTGQ